MSVQGYSGFSLYSATNEITGYGINYLNFWTPPNLLVTTNDTLISLPAKYDKRPDLLSYDYYKTPEYWWVFMMRNPNIISDPIWDFRTGIQIFVPAKENLPRSIS